MRSTLFEATADATRITSTDEPAWEPASHEGEVVPDAYTVVLHEHSGATFLLFELREGSSYPMHTGPDYAHCQVVRGRGKMGFPDGRILDYDGPELFIFEPGTLHDWHGISEDTLLSICLTRDPAAGTHG